MIAAGTEVIVEMAAVVDVTVKTTDDTIVIVDTTVEAGREQV